MRRTTVLLFLSVIIFLIIIVSISYIVNYRLNNKNNGNEYVETHMEYEQDKKFLKTDPGYKIFVNDTPIIPTGFFRQYADPVEDDDYIRIVYYIPEKYINGNNELMNINGNKDVTITTKVTPLPENIQITDITDYLEILINDFNDKNATISIQKIDCENSTLYVLKTEYENHNLYELIYTHKDRAYSLLYEISNKANNDELDIMKKVFASMKLVNIALEVE